MNIYEFSIEIAKLNREKKYKEALSFFKKNKSKFSKEEIKKNEYIVADIITCLRHAGYIDDGFKFLEYFGIIINEEQKERILIAYGWLLWAKYKSEHN